MRFFISHYGPKLLQLQILKELKIVMKKELFFIFIFLLLMQGNSQLCPVLCNTCGGGSTCSNCYPSFQNGLSLTSSISGTCPCPNGFYMNTATQLCLFCPITCQTCTSQTVCLTCISGYQIDNNKLCAKKFSNNGQWLTMDIATDLTQQKLQKNQVQGFYLFNYVASMSMSSSIRNCSGLGSTLFFGLYSFDYNTQIIKSYFGLPFHDWIHIRFQFLAADRWNLTQMILEINDRQSFNITTLEGVSFTTQKTYSSSNRQRNFCLSSDPDNLGFMDVSLSHTTSMLKLRLRTSLSSLNNSDPSDYPSYVYFGLRNVFVRVGTCPKNCKRCISPTKCLECISPYITPTPNNGTCICNLNISQMTQLGRCVPLCQNGYLFTKLSSMNQSKCMLCKNINEDLQNCFICSVSQEIANTIVCQVCLEGYYLNSSGKCAQDCSASTSVNVTYLANYTMNKAYCQTCGSNCTSCYFSSCTNCVNNTIFYQGNCITTCLNGFYYDSTTHECYPCNKNCAKCTSFSVCTQCIDTQNFTLLTTGICAIKCQFFNNCTSIICNSDCNTCFGTQSNECLTCKVSTNYLQNYNCVTQCSPGYFALTNKICQPCQYPCASCVNKMACSSCITGYFLFQQTCIRQCPLNYFSDVNRACKVCQSNCLKCIDQSTCLQCANNYILFGGICMIRVTCGTGTYYDENLNKCINCQQNCTSCYKDVCYMCNMNEVLDNGKCLASCSNQKIEQLLTFTNQSTSATTTYRVCKWKNPLCNRYTIVNGNSVCNQCIFMNPPLVLIQDQYNSSNYICSFNCPIKMVKVINNNVVSCQSCPNECQQCLTNLTCIRCNTNYVLNPITGTSCISNCPGGYTSDGYQCLPCLANCKTCDITGKCIECFATFLLASNNCLPDTNCQSNQFKVTAGDNCANCSTNCLSCSGNSATCTSCGLYQNTTQLYLKLGSCVLDCNSGTPGYFKLNQGFECKKCPSICTSCVSLTECTTCVQGYYLLSYPIQRVPGTIIGACVQSCPIGYYNFNPYNSISQISMCAFCAPNCLTCYGPSQNQCLSCYGTFKMDHNSRCVELCPASKYEDANRHCDWCHPSCMSCYGPGQFQCISCQTNYYLYRSICFSYSCPGSTYAVDYDNRICQACQWGCQVCSSPYNCSVCTGGFFLYQGWCYLQCPQNTQPYLDLVNQGYRCGNCTKRWQNCLQCTIDQCQRCDGLYYLIKNSTVSSVPCVTNCPLGYFGLISLSRQCVKCATQCMNCTSLTNCSSCNRGYVLINGLCTKTCLNNQYFVASLSSCKNCSQYCLNCISEYLCQNCLSGYYMVSQTKNGSTYSYCSSVCPDGFYKDDSSGTCKKCSQNCVLCSNSTSCTKCISTSYQIKNGYCYLSNSTTPNCNITHCSYCLSSTVCQLCQIPYYLYNSINAAGQTVSTCVSNCPVGFYENGRSCQPCNSTCVQCNSSQNNCSNCISGLYLHQQRCWNVCPLGYYQNIGSDNLRSCKICPLQCYDCQNSTYCISCQSDYKLYKGLCYKSCPEKTYPSGLVCLDCLALCKTCKSSYYCDECQSPYLVYEGKCMTQCPNTYYLSLQDLTCKRCVYPCLTCKSQSYCSTCVSGFILQTTSLTCVDHCNAGFYLKYTITSGYQCVPCSTGCKNCFNSTYCEKCNSNFYTWGGKCYQNCPIGTFNEETTKTCRPCAQYCFSCTSSSCVQCHNQTILFQGQCLSFCPFGTYFSMEYSYSLGTTITTCKKCLSPCLQCNSSSVYNCLSCISGYYFFQNYCLLSCPAKHYADNISNKCIKCPVGCITCNAQGCSLCQTNWMLSGNKQCTPNSNCTLPNCQVCQNVNISVTSNLSVCLKCVQPYNLISDTLLPAGSNTRTGSNSSCILICPAGTYRQENFTCYACPANCSTCTSLISCSSCKSPFYLFKNSCIQICPNGYLGSTTGICNLVPCLYNNSQNLCEKCLSPYLLQQGVCVSSCSSGYFQHQAFCKKCDSATYRCLTCVSLTTCTTCLNGYILYQGICLLQCPSGFYYQARTNISQQCRSCKSVMTGCLTCSSATACLKCEQPYFLNSSNLCSLECQDGYYKSLSQQICVKCQQNCISCLNKTSCTTCNSITTSYNGDCLIQCPSPGFYKSRTTNSCEKCNQRCYACVSLTNCTLCQPNYVLLTLNVSNQVTSSCVQVCPSGYYESINSTCILCGSQCLTCDYQKCLSCPTGKYLFNGKCLTVCPEHYYNAVNGQCLVCNTECKTCVDSPQMCTNCYPGYNYINTSKTCVRICQKNQYYDSSTFSCKQCSPDCQSCYGPRYDQCLTCNSPLALYNYICVLKCPDSMFKDIDTVCKMCDLTKCLNCQNSPSNCTSCSYPKMFMIQNNAGVCKDNCGEGYYYDATYRQCKQCQAGCLSCINDQICILCDDLNYLYDGRCIDNCPTGYAAVNGTSQNVCKRCPSNCMTCSYVQTTGNIQCTQCIPTFYLINKLCYDICPTGTYLNSSLCVSCPDKCATCVDSTNCLTCKYPYLLSAGSCLTSCPADQQPLNNVCYPKKICSGYVYNNTCYSSCPVGTYISSGTNNCVNCPNLCSECTSDTKCTNCLVGFYLYVNPSTSASSCVQSCPTGTYINNKYCVSCPSPCATCSASIDTVNCLTCTTGYLFEGKCVSTCPNGYFAAANNTCTSCSPNCLSCITSPACTVCANPKYILPNCDTSNTVCATGYVSPVTNGCQNCNSVCLTCFGPSSGQCKSCKNVSSVVYYLYETSCLTDCPQGYGKDSVNNKCSSCSVSNCRNCSTSLTSCTACVSGFILVVSGSTAKCVQSCSELNTASNTYILNSTLNTCTGCSSLIENCLQCFYSLTNQKTMCSNCIPNFYLLSNNTCSSCTTPGYIISQSKYCIQCDPLCNLCQNQAACKTCSIPSVLYLGKCYTICPTGFYNNSGVCTACTDKCKSCTSSGCTECISPYALDGSNQCTSCISGYFYKASASSCQKCNSNCQQCLNTQTSCTKCTYPLFLLSTACYYNCPTGYFGTVVSNDSICLICDGLVADCSVCTSQGCKICKNNFFLYQAPSTNNLSCVSTCTAGTYPETVTMTCIQCNITNCVQCSSNSQCTKCTSTTYYVNGACLSSCPSGYAPAASRVNNNLVCQKCKSGCKTCSPTINDCTVCQQNLQNDGTGMCTLKPNSCNTGQYLNSVGNCSLCDQSCVTCYGGSRTNCLTCHTPEYQLQSDGSCKQYCADNEYYDSGTSSCKPCSTKYGQYCTSCDSAKCFVCSNGTLSSDFQTCASSCIQGTYQYNGICINCPQYCKTCNSSTYCSECNTNNPAYLLYNNLCYSSCPTGTQSFNNTCRNCLSSCLNCVNTASNCTSCISSHKLYQTTCVTVCPNGTYETTTAGVTGSVCLNCMSPCSNCSIVSTNCTSCSSPYFLYSNTCIDNCPSGTFADNRTQTCRQCTYPCKTCSQSSTFCQSCQSGFVYNSQTNNCSNQCSDGSYFYTNTTTSLSSCIPCSLSNCKQCDVNGTCHKCTNSYYATFDSAGLIISCTTTCPNQFFIQTSTQTCQKCFTNCLVCTTSSNCQKCSSLYYLYNNTCLSSCPATTYNSGSASTGYKCQNCGPLCNICTNNVTCTDCLTGSFLLNGTCFTTCPQGYFQRSTDRTCRPCAVSNCKTCTSTDCSACITNYYGFLNTATNQIVQCLANCGDNYFINYRTQMCQACLTGCKSCVNNNQCQQCQTSKALLIIGSTYSCLDQCPFTYYKDDSSTPIICKSCESNCKQCYSQSDCYNCEADYYLINTSASEDQCLADCPFYYYQAINNQGFNQCKNCSSHCLKCTSATTCTLCQSTHTLINNVCIPNNCVNCSVCDQTVDPPVCRNCINPYYLYKSRCTTTCPIYYFGTLNASNGVQYCEKCMDKCINCSDVNTCNQCIPLYIFVKQKGCVDAAVQQFGQVANMSGFTSNITQTLATIYMGTSVGPVAFGQMSSTYFNIQFTQMMLFHPPGGNPQMTQFLNSLQTMSLTTGGGSSANTSSPQQVSRRLLMSSNLQQSFIQVNAPIFFLMFAFLAAYASIFIFQKFVAQACRTSCNNAWFYADTICDFMKKRFKWIYFDFVMWLSYIPFLYFSVMQLKSFNFDTASHAISSLLAIAIIATYPMYPVFICYLLHSNYSQISLQPGEQPKSTLTQMSLSPYLTKVKRPIKNYVVPFQQQPFSFQKYFKTINFILIYYPLKYVRKFSFILCAAIIVDPVNMVGTLIAINIAFIVYIIVLKPRQMPYLAFDLIIQFVLLAFEVLLFVYLMLDGPKIALMSIITHVVGFITANLSIITAIVLNLVAYYKIFLCIKDLIGHIREKAVQRQQAQNKFQIQKKFLDPQSQYYIDKQIGKLKRLGDNDDTDQDDDSFRLSNGGRKLLQNMGQKQLLLNGIDPIKYIKQITKAQNYKFQQKNRALKYVNEDDVTDSDDSDLDQNTMDMMKKLEMDEKTLALNKIHPVKFVKQLTKDDAPLQKRYKKFDQKHVDKLIARRINDDGATDSDDQSLDQETMNIVKNLNLNEKQLAMNQINPVQFLKQQTKKDAPLQEQYKKFDQKNVSKKLAKIINEDNATDSDDSQIDQDMHDLAKKLQLNQKQLAFNQINPVKFFKDQTKKDAPLQQQYQKFDQKNMGKVLAHRINQDHQTDSDDDSSIDQDAHNIAKKLNLNQKQLAHNQINPLQFFKQETKKQAPLQQVYKKFDEKNVDRQLIKAINDDGDTDSQNESQDQDKQEAYRLARDLKLNEKQLAANNLKPIKVMQDEAKKDQKLKNIIKKFDQKDMDLKVARMINDNGQTSSQSSSQDQQQIDKIIVARELKLDQKQLAANNINPMKFVKQSTKVDPITKQPKINNAILSTSVTNKNNEKARKKLLDKQLQNRNQMKRQLSQNSGTDEDQEDIRLTKYTKQKLKNMTEKQMMMQGLDPIKAVKKITKQAIAKKMAKKMNNQKNNRVYDDQMPDFKVSSSNNTNSGGLKNAIRSTQQKLKQSTKNMLGSSKKKNAQVNQRLPSQQSHEFKNGSNLLDSQSDHQYTKLTGNKQKMIKSVTPQMQTRQYKLVRNNNINRIDNQWNDQFEGIQDQNQGHIIIDDQRANNRKQGKNSKIPLIDPNNKIKNFEQQFKQQFQESYSNSQQSSQLALKALIKPTNQQDIQEYQLQHIKSNKNIVSPNKVINLDVNEVYNGKLNPKLSKDQKNHQTKKSNSQLNIRNQTKNVRQDQMFNQFQQFQDLGANINTKKITEKKHKRKSKLHNSDLEESDQLQEEEITDFNTKEIKEAKHKREGNHSSRLPGVVADSVTFNDGNINSNKSIVSSRSNGNQKYEDIVKNNKMALKLPTSFQNANQIFEEVQYESRPVSTIAKLGKGVGKSSLHSDNSQDQNDYSNNVRKDRISARQKLRSNNSNNPSENGLDSKRSSQVIKIDRQSKKKIQKLKIQNMSQNQDEIESIDV